MGKMKNYRGRPDAVCKKRRYADEIDAMLGLAELHQKKKKARRERSYYCCRKCSGFHLTSSKQTWVHADDIDDTKGVTR